MRSSPAAQADIYGRSGVEIDRSVMAGWVGHMAALLEPLAERIARHVRAGAALHADDTPVPVLDPGRGRTKTGRLWTAVRDERPYGSTAPPAAFYLYSPDRKAERAHALLKGCPGHLHADAYAGFAGLYEADPLTGAPAPLTEVACWAHARRKIYDIHVETKSPAAAQALELIARLFAIEADIKGRPPAERLAARRGKATPVLSELRAFLEATMEKVSGKSSFAGAFRYAASRWTALTAYVGDGRLEMTTDGADKRESSARRSGHGRSRGWLFLPRRHHSLVGVLSTPHVVGFPLADLLDPIVPTWSHLAILARSAGFERCFA